MPFERGKSGNPKGRPKSQAPTTAKELREAISARSIELLNKLIDVALVDGDVQALKYLIDKVLPPLPPEQPQTTPVKILSINDLYETRSLDDFYADCEKEKTGQ